MLRKASEAVPEGNDPVPLKEELGSGQPMTEDVYRMIKEALVQWDKMLNEILDKMEEQTEVLKKQRLTRLEHGARQPRLATEADGQADTKTRERTEGAATAVQAMRGDCFSARRVEPGPTTNPTRFGVKAEPPALPCRDDSVVECGTAASESCLPSMEMRPSIASGGLVPTGEASNASKTTYNQPPLRFCSTEKTDHLEAKTHGLQFHPPRTTAAASGDCLLLPTAGGSLTQNPGKIGSLIQAVLEVTSAPARLWDRGARWFMVRFEGLGQLKRASAFFRTRFAGSLEKGRF